MTTTTSAHPDEAISAAQKSIRAYVTEIGNALILPEQRMEMPEDRRPELLEEASRLNKTAVAIAEKLSAVRTELEAAERNYDEWAPTAASQKATIAVLNDRIRSLERLLAEKQAHETAIQKEIVSITEDLTVCAEHNAVSDQIESAQREVTSIFLTFIHGLDRLRSLSTTMRYESAHLRPENQRRLAYFANTGIVGNFKERVIGKTGGNFIAFLTQEKWTRIASEWPALVEQPEAEAHSVESPKPKLEPEPKRTFVFGEDAPCERCGEVRKDCVPFGERPNILCPNCRADALKESMKMEYQQQVADINTWVRRYRQ